MSTLNDKKVLMVLTSHAALGDTGETTGFWVEEFAAPYYTLTDAGVQVTLASVAGGQPPIDPKSELADFQTDDTRRFDQDRALKAELANTLKLADINAGDFDAVFYPGGHGPLWDLTENPASVALIEAFLAADKPVATVCHATAALLNIKDAQGNYAVKGRAVSGFTNSEEAAVELTDVVPFLLEDELVKRGADFQNAGDWQAFAVQDDLIISGQNPMSSALTAQKLLEAL